MSSTTEAPSFEALLATAHALADRAAEVILPHFRKPGVVDHKGGQVFNPVTAADRDAETAIRQIIAERYPDHGVLGEEFGASRTDADYCWVVDPIDGTSAFIIGQPIWGCLIGLLRDGEPVLGLMDQPFTEERFWSGETQAYYRHDDVQPIRTRTCPSLAEAMLASTGPDLFAPGDELARFEGLSRAVKLTRFGGDCYNYCLLALGQLDLVVEAGLNPFDIIPLIPIVTRAGGVVSRWDGGDAKAGGRIVAAGDPHLHALAVNALSG